MKPTIVAQITAISLLGSSLPKATDQDLTSEYRHPPILSRTVATCHSPTETRNFNLDLKVGLLSSASLRPQADLQSLIDYLTQKPNTQTLSEQVASSKEHTAPKRTLSKEMEGLISEIETALKSDPNLKVGELKELIITGGMISGDNLREFLALAKTGELSVNFIIDTHNLNTFQDLGYLEYDLGPTLLDRTKDQGFRELSRNFDRLSEAKELGAIDQETFNRIYQEGLLDKLDSNLRFETGEDREALLKVVQFHRLKDAADFALARGELNADSYREIFTNPTSHSTEINEFIQRQENSLRAEAEQVKINQLIASGYLSEARAEQWELTKIPEERRAGYIEDLESLKAAVESGLLAPEIGTAFEGLSKDQQSSILQQIRTREANELAIDIGQSEGRISFEEKKLFLQGELSEQEEQELLLRAKEQDDER